MARPSEYKTEYCEKIIKLGEQGKHVAAYAAALNCSIETLYDWSRRHECFRYAFRRARDLSRAYWEDLGLSNVTNSDFQYKVWEFNLRAKHGLGDKDRTFKGKLNIDQDDSLSTKCSKLLDALNCGNLTADESVKLADTFTKVARIEEVEELKRKIEQYEKDAGIKD